MRPFSLRFSLRIDFAMCRFIESMEVDCDETVSPSSRSIHPSTVTHMKQNQSTLSWLLPVLLFAGSLTFAPTTIHAASTDPVQDLTFIPSTLVEYLRAELRSNDAVRRENALVDAVALSYCSASCALQFRSIPGKTLRIDNDLGFGTASDLNLLAPDLVKAYRSGPTDGHRILALSALINIGNERAIERLLDSSIAVSPRVHRVTQKGLASFYLGKYPDLTKRAMRRGTFSLDDVKTARLRQERILRKEMRRG